MVRDSWAERGRHKLFEVALGSEMGRFMAFKNRGVKLISKDPQPEEVV